MTESFKEQIEHFLSLEEVTRYDCVKALSICQFSRSKEDLQSIDLAMSIISKKYPWLKGAALASIAYYHKSWKTGGFDKAQKIAVEALHQCQEAYPNSLYNLYYIGYSYLRGFDLISYEEALYALKKVEEYGDIFDIDEVYFTPAHFLMLDIIKIKPSIFDEKRFLKYAELRLIEFPDYTIRRYLENETINQLIKTPTLWIKTLKPYAHVDTSIKDLLINLCLESNAIEDALDVLESCLKNADWVNEVDLLIFATIGEHLKKQSFFQGLRMYADKVKFCRPIADFVENTRSYDQNFSDYYPVGDYSELAIQTESWQEFDCLNTYEEWASTSRKSKTLFITFKNIIIRSLKFALQREEAEINKFKLKSPQNRKNTIAMDNCCGFILALAIIHETPESIVTHLMDICGNNDFSKFISFQLEIVYPDEKTFSGDLPYVENLIKAFPWYSPLSIPKSAQKYINTRDLAFACIGEPEACDNIGDFLEDKKQYQLAFECYKRGAANGNLSCMRSLAFAYWGGEGTSRNIPLALYWFTLASQSDDDPMWISCIGHIFKYEFEDPETAFHFYEISAKQNDDQGLFQYALARFDGIGCKVDQTEAITILKQLIDKGDDLAIKWVSKRNLTGVLQNWSTQGKTSPPACGGNQTKANIRYICLDTETTGLNDLTDRVCEIAAVEFDPNTFKTLSRFHVYINPQREIPSRATAIHGLTNDFLKGKPVFGAIVQDFQQYIQNAEVFIHNATYDTKMLNAELRRLGLHSLDYYCRDIHCTLKLAVKLRGRGHNRLDDLCDAYGIDRSKRVQHEALLDCELLIKVLQAMKQRGAAILSA